jgi:hypothetical protein
MKDQSMSQQPDPSALPDLPTVTFGEIKEASLVVDWRADTADDPHDDTPHDVLVAILGFDPDEVDDEGNDLSEVPE